MDLMQLLPKRYDKSPNTVAIQQALGVEVDKITEAWQEMLLQLNVETATWGLTLWEQQYGLSNGGKSMEQRREAILAKMRGVGTATVDMIRRVVQSYYQRPVEILEVAPEYKFIIIIDGEEMVNLRRSDVDRALWEIKPAHLEHEYLARTKVQGTVWAGGWSCWGVRMGTNPE